jgi:predicted type IV restriction endonuclease
MMQRAPMSSRTLSEAAVREEIISPILRALHYSSNGENDVRYGLSLRYPHDVLGRKNPVSDRRIRGVADYLCRAGRTVPWIIEAKPAEPITDDDVEQAYSYAKHPEI